MLLLQSHRQTIDSKFAPNLVIEAHLTDTPLRHGLSLPRQEDFAVAISRNEDLVVLVLQRLNWPRIKRRNLSRKLTHEEQDQDQDSAAATADRDIWTKFSPKFPRTSPKHRPYGPKIPPLFQELQQNFPQKKAHRQSLIYPYLSNWSNWMHDLDFTTSYPGLKNPVKESKSVNQYHKE